MELIASHVVIKLIVVIIIRKTWAMKEQRSVLFAALIFLKAYH